MAVSKRLRFEIFRRDNHTCRYCGASAPDVTLEPDHVVPVTLGGTDEPSNLVTACQDCNSGKTSTSPDSPLVEDVEQDALRWSKAMEKAAELQREDSDKLEIATESVRDFWVDIWNEDQDDNRPLVVEGKWWWPDNPDVTFGWGVEVDGRVVHIFHEEYEAQERAERILAKNAPPMADDWRSAARTWITSGITSRDYVPLMYMVRDERGYVQWDQRWKYLAGCVWNVIRERQKIASDLLEVGTQDDDDGDEVPW